MLDLGTFILLESYLNTYLIIMFWRVRLYLDYSPLFKVKLYKTSWKFWWKWSEALFKVRNSKPVLPHPFLACTGRHSNFFLFSYAFLCFLFLLLPLSTPGWHERTLLLNLAHGPNLVRPIPLGPCLRLGGLGFLSSLAFLSTYGPTSKYPSSQLVWKHAW